MKNRIKLKRFEKTLDTEEFQKLADLLFEATGSNNNAYCARLLGVSTVTWKGWLKKPPKWVWWNEVLRLVIKEVLANLIVTNNHKTKTRKHKQRIQDALNALPRSQELLEQVHDMANNYTSSQRHLRKLLSKGGMFWHDIRLQKNSGGFTEKTLRVAARKLDVVQTSTGFGAEKTSFWRLPTVEDEEDQA